MGRTLAVCVCIAVAFAMSDQVRPPLTNEDVIALFKAGFSEPVILQAIEINTPHFDLSATALKDLKNAGAGEAVIAAMAASRSASQHLRLLDPGVYVKRGDAWALVEAEPVAWQVRGAESSRGQVLRASLTGRVENRTSHLSLTGPAELLIVAEPGASAADYQILRADDREDYREFRADAAVRGDVILGLSGSPYVTAVRDNTFDLGVRVLLGTLRKGEYGVVPQLRRSTPDGRIYTFSID